MGTGHEAGARRSAPWTAALVGGLLGVGITLLFAVLWDPLRYGGEASEAPRTEHRVAFFRLPGGSDRELYVLPAGPEGRGEDRLAQALAGDGRDPTDLVSIYVANLAPDGEWQVDLAETPIRVRTGGKWSELVGVAPDAVEDAVARVRARALGAGRSALVLEPGRAGRFLFALPAGRTFADVSGVQWGERELLADERPDADIRAMLEDPARHAPGR